MLLSPRVGNNKIYIMKLTMIAKEPGAGLAPMRQIDLILRTRSESYVYYFKDRVVEALTVYGAQGSLVYGISVKRASTASDEYRYIVVFQLRKTMTYATYNSLRSRLRSLVRSERYKTTKENTEMLSYLRNFQGS